MTNTNNQEEKMITKKYTIAEAKDIILKFATVNRDLTHTLEKVASSVLPLYYRGTPEEKSKVFRELEVHIPNVMRALETETHIGLMETFDERSQIFAKELTVQIIKDNSCITATERCWQKLSLMPRFEL